MKSKALLPGLIIAHEALLQGESCLLPTRCLPWDPGFRVSGYHQGHDLAVVLKLCIWYPSAHIATSGTRKDPVLTGPRLSLSLICSYRTSPKSGAASSSLYTLCSSTAYRTNQKVRDSLAWGSRGVPDGVALTSRSGERFGIARVQHLAGFLLAYFSQDN
jgi:hypothetical protein